MIVIQNFCVENLKNTTTNSQRRKYKDINDYHTEYKTHLETICQTTPFILATIQVSLISIKNHAKIAVVSRDIMLKSQW